MRPFGPLSLFGPLSPLHTAIAACLALCALSEDRPAPTLRETAQQINTRRATIQTIVARLSVTLRDLKNSKEYHLLGACIGDAAGNMRLRITAESGQLLLDVGTRGDELQIHMAGRERLLTGERGDLLGFPRCALAPLARCSSASDLFFPAVLPEGWVGKGSCRLNGKSIFNSAEKKRAGIGCCTRRASMSGANVERVEWFLCGGVSGGCIEYSAHRADAAPGRISIRPAGGEYALDLDIDDLTLNTNIPAAKFKLPEPPASKREALGEALARNVNFWE